jgi:uncharacterized repeat protein (TIGR01451 family)
LRTATGTFAACLFLLGSLLAGEAGAVLVCGTPGASGPGFPSGVINDYWAGSGSPAAGSGSITVGTRRAGGAGSSITAGDLVLIIQMQDADINSNNTASYGGNDGTGSGATAINRAGLYEYVRATNTVGAGGGVLTFSPALTNGYRTRNYAAGSNGQSRWQAIRVPQYSSATANNVTAPAWNGTTGGVVAMDVETALTLSGATAIDVAGLGFRGGAGRQLAGAAGADTDYRTSAGTTTNAAKGEGISGTPRYINNTVSYNAAPAVTDTGLEGYPNGSYARGAPGNAGGGGTDGNPSANDQNSGGGGGSNYGFGGQGGNAWNSGDPSGGRGGAPFSSLLAPNRVFLGGGGGAGTTNNGTYDAATYTNPAGVSCTAGAGACSSGAAGGGIVLIRAGSISGGGLIDARGADAYNVENDGSGGGGGGGVVVLQSYFGGSASVNVSGGDGGNCWRSRNTLIDRHGPGGGGGGGYIAYSPSTGFAVTANYNAGLSGRSSNDDPYGSTSGNGGIATFDLPNVPGVQPGTFCPPAIKAVSLAVDNGVAGVVDTGDTVEYTVAYRNGSSSSIPGFNITDPLPAGMNFVAGSLTVTPAGGASGNANGSYDGGASTSLLASNITLPAGGIVTARFRATANATVCSNVLNQANSVQSGGDVLGLTDNADNTQNEGGLPSGAYIVQAPYGTGGASDPTGFTMGCPDLSTSTKSWVDLNGGDQNPGDVLRYTITVTDSGGGTVTGVTVTDDIPLDVSAFAVVSIPTGASDSSTGSGGANGTGYLNITGITVPAAGSVSVVFDVTIPNGTASGTTIDNSATVINPLGLGAAPAAPQVTVTSSFAPISGNKPLYLSGAPGLTLSRTPTTGNPAYIRIPELETGTWTLSGPLASDVTLDPALSATVPVNLYMASNTNRTISATVTLSCSSGGSISQTLSENLGTTPELYNPPFELPLGAPFTCPAGSFWELTIRNNTSGSGTRDLRVYPVNGTNLNPAIPNGGISQVILPSANVINVDSITFFDAAYSGGSSIASVTAGTSVYVRATVSDPFGSYDINANPPATLPTITVTDPGGTTVVAAAAMTELGPLTTAGTKTFEYAYTVPGGGPVGNWTMRVDAVEGTENTVSDYGLAAMPVVAPQPLLTVVKSASGTTANPGDVVTYSVQVINTGAGAATAVTLDDHLSSFTAFGFDSYGAGVPFQFVEGTPSSGLALGPPVYSSDGGSTYSYPPSSGFDGSVTNWRIPMIGTMNPNGGRFTLRYQVQVK